MKEATFAEHNQKLHDLLLNTKHGNRDNALTYCVNYMRRTTSLSLTDIKGILRLYARDWNRGEGEFDVWDDEKINREIESKFKRYEHEGRYKPNLPNKIRAAEQKAALTVRCDPTHFTLTVEDVEILDFIPDEPPISEVPSGDIKGFRTDWRRLPEYVGVAGDDIVDGLLPSGSNGKLFVCGERKCGKTTLGLSLGLAIAQGTPAFGTRKTRKSRVTFVDLELTAQSVIDVLNKQVKALGKPEEGYFDVIGGQSFRVNDPESINELGNLLLKFPSPEVVIFDSIYALVDDINNMEQTQAVLDLLSKIITELNAAVIILHHTSDPSELTATKKPLGYLGRQFDRWCGVTLTYKQVADESLYRSLKGVRRGGDGNVALYLQYIETFQMVIEVDWSDIPGTKKDKLKLLGEHPRVLVVKEVCGMAKTLHITKLSLAERWGISDNQIRNYLDDGDVPQDTVFEKILATRDELTQRIGQLHA